MFKPSSKPSEKTLNIKILNEIIERKNAIKFLGVYIDEKLQWHDHINYIKNKLNSSLYTFKKGEGYLEYQSPNYTILFFDISIY